MDSQESGIPVTQDIYDTSKASVVSEFDSTVGKAIVDAITHKGMSLNVAASVLGTILHAVHADIISQEMARRQEMESKSQAEGSSIVLPN